MSNEAQLLTARQKITQEAVCASAPHGAPVKTEPALNAGCFSIDVGLAAGW